ncbi:hypothetical protein V6N13_018734 [Hibiscus sabdariffa]
MINGYCKAKRIDEAMELFNEKSRIGPTPDNVTYNTLMQGMFQLGRVTAACKLLGKMLASGLVPSRVTCMILLDGLCKSGKLKVALKIFQAMRNSGLELDIIFYNILINGLCKTGHIEEAKELFHKLSVEGLKPTIYTYTIMINEFCKVGLPDEAYQLFKSMGDDECLPDSISYNVMVQGLFRNNYTSKATQLLAEMVDKGGDNSVPGLRPLHNVGLGVDRGSGSPEQEDVGLREMEVTHSVITMNIQGGWNRKAGVVASQDVALKPSRNQDGAAAYGPWMQAPSRRKRVMQPRKAMRDKHVTRREGPSVSTKGKMVGVHGVGSSKGTGLDRKGYSRSVQEPLDALDSVLAVMDVRKQTSLVPAVGKGGKMSGRGANVKVASTRKAEIEPTADTPHPSPRVANELGDRSFSGPIRKSGGKGTHRFNPKILDRQALKVAKKGGKHGPDIEPTAVTLHPSPGVATEPGQPLSTQGTYQVVSTIDDTVCGQ